MLRLYLFYIILQTVASAVEYDYTKNQNSAPETYDRITKKNEILSNLHTLFKKRSIINDNTKSSDEYNDINFNQKTDREHLDTVLTEVTDALDKIKDELMKFNRDGMLEIEIPRADLRKRFKRDASNETVDIATSTDNNVTQINVTTTETVETVTETVEAVRTNNETLLTDVVHERNDTELPVSGRRMLSNNFISTSSKIKEKLLSYLEDTFNEVEEKIKPLTNIKIALSNDDNYKIGYIIATIDTLEVNLRKLKNDMNLHQNIWDDEKIIELFDRIKATSTAATTLIETLKKYLPKQ